MYAGHKEGDWRCINNHPLANQTQNDAFSCGIYVCAIMDMLSYPMNMSIVRTALNKDSIDRIRRQMEECMNGFILT